MTRTRCRRDETVHLGLRRVRGERAAAAVAAAPVRHLPVELLDALMGSWGTPEEFGLTPYPRLRLVAG